MLSTNQGQASILCAGRHAALGPAVALAPTFSAMPSAPAQTYKAIDSFAGRTDGATPRPGDFLCGGQPTGGPLRFSYSGDRV